MFKFINKERTVYKGHHWSFPFTIHRVGGNGHTFYVKAEDPQMWSYVLNGEDQKDWNKLVGLKKNFFQPKKNSIMVGWRFDPHTQEVQFTPYWHDSKGNAYYWDDNKCASIDYNIFLESNPVVIIHINKVSISVSILDSLNTYHSVIPHEANVSYKNWLITHWFGGTSPSPKKIKFKVSHFPY